MIQNRSDIEQEDALIVKEAIEAIGKNDLTTARRLLQEVIANVPEEYVYSYEEGEHIFIKFWAEDEFLQYVAGLDDQQKKKHIIWIPSAYPRAFFYLAYIDVEEGMPESAIGHLQSSLKLEPDQPVSLCEMALICSKMGQHKKALSIYDQAIHGRTYITSQARARALRGKGVELIEIEEFDLAKQCLIESLKYEPNNKIALDEMFYISLLRTGADVTSPIRLVKTAIGEKKCSVCGKELITTYNNEFKVINIEGKLLFLCTTCGDEETYKKGIRVKYNYAEAFYNQGIGFVKQGHIEDAAEVFKKAISIEQDYLAAHFALGMVYIELENYQEALKSFKEAIKIKPDYAEAYYYLGDAYVHLEQYQEAIERYNQAIQINPDFAEAHHSLGWALHLLGRSSEAIESLRQAIRINPNYSDPYFFLGRVFSDLGHNQESIEAFKEDTRINPKDPMTHYFLAKNYITLLDKESALGEYDILKNLDAAIANVLLEEINKVTS